MQFLFEKAIFWKRKNLLILADLHLGKAGHFRKHGIPISNKIHRNDLRVFQELLDYWKPTQVFILGDLFHSTHNNEWKYFVDFLHANQSTDFFLIKGNHDILSGYPNELKVFPYLEIPPFSFSHKKEDSSLYNISGHIHPGVRVFGKARQSLTFPCFWFSEDFGILPSFGGFTGLKHIKPCQGDRIFGITSDSIIELAQ